MVILIHVTMAIMMADCGGGPQWRAVVGCDGDYDDGYDDDMRLLMTAMTAAINNLWQ